MFKQLLMTWMLKLHFQMTITVVASIAIDTNEPGRIIGYHGKVLKALQLLAQNYLYNRYSRTFYITIMSDMSNTVQKSCRPMLKKLATRVLEEGRSHQTDPMSNSERKIIHRIISRMDGVTSYSEGDEPKSLCRL